MAIADDFTIDYTLKTIKHTSGSTVYSVNALYTYLQDTFDELSQMDDAIPMSAQTPTDYTLINGWFMDDTSFQYLDGGAIQTSGYADEIHVLTLDGSYVNCVAGDIGKQVTDDAVEVGALLAYDNTLQKWWIRIGSATPIADNSVIAITAGTGAGTAAGASVTGEDLWPNIYSLGSIYSGTSIYIEQNGSVLSSWWPTNHIDILVKVKEAGTEIDNAEITVFARELGYIYDHYDIDLSTGGRQAIPLATSADLNNQTAQATIEDWQDGTISTIAIAFGTYAYDVSGDGSNENYEIQIDCNNQPIENVYEVCKYWTAEDSTKSLDSPAVQGKIYISANTATYTPEKRSPLGTFAGGKFFGARGVYLINVHADDIQAYQLIDSDGNTVNPPNNQALQVSGVVSGDRVGVFKTSGGEIDKAQYTNTVQSLGASTIVIGEAIPADTPSSGTIIVVDVDNDEEHVYPYSSWTGSTFTLDAVTTTANYDTNDRSYVPYIYKEATSTSVSVSLTYVSDRAVLTRVRKKGILPFEVAGTFGATGLSVTAIRTTDSIVA